MIEYTSFEASRRLEELGFKEEPDAGVWRGASGCFHYQETLNDATDWSHMSRAYRSDTLLAFLIGKGWDISTGKPHDKVLVDAASMKLNRGLAVEGDTIPDALADVVFAIIAPPPKEDAR